MAKGDLWLQMKTLRDNAVAALSVRIDELEGHARNHQGYDDRAAAVIRSAGPYIIALRDRYADGAPAPLPSDAAQEMRDLSDVVRKIGEESGNHRAAECLAHESDMISFFVMSHDLAVDSAGRFHFDRTL